MAVLVVAFSFLTLAASFWPYMIPYTVTVEDAAAPPQSPEFFPGAAILWFFRLC